MKHYELFFYVYLTQGGRVRIVPLDTEADLQKRLHLAGVKLIEVEVWRMTMRVAMAAEIGEVDCLAAIADEMFESMTYEVKGSKGGPQQTELRFKWPF